MSFKVVDTPTINISPSILKDLESLVHEDGQVTIHFLFKNGNEENLIRIWSTSYLLDHASKHSSELIHHVNISLYPIWTLCEANTTCHFTLIFSGLPISCSKFDFIEYCNGNPGAFEVRNITRNNNDVYFIKID